MNALKNEKPVPQIASSAPKVVEAEKPKTKSEDGRMSQREAVYVEIMATLKSEKVNFDGTTNVKPHMTEERLKKVYANLATAFKAKKVVLKDTPNNQKKLTDEGELKNYIIGLVNNWIRRDPRLNGKPKQKSS
ncbi:MAG: hypothetical protein JST80_10910 [Bdellovibrionales bacterium]|nr:hypothetical protein [Bdellovibrionales bacterium]